MKDLYLSLKKTAPYTTSGLRQECDVGRITVEFLRKVTFYFHHRAALHNYARNLSVMFRFCSPIAG